MGRNELVSYIRDIEDLYGDNEDEQVYIAKLMKDNMGRLPNWCLGIIKNCQLGPCEPARQCSAIHACIVMDLTIKKKNHFKSLSVQKE